MNDDDRSQFLQFPKPDNLPIDLAQNLAQNLKTWIHDIYAPAYITFMISQVDSKDVTWRWNLTDDEKAKVWYWWSGAVNNPTLICPLPMANGSLGKHVSFKS